VLQMTNIIRAEENGASVPYVVYERISLSSTYKPREGLKLIMGRYPTMQDAPTHFVCEQIKDAEWTDIPDESLK
jgi:hypothetical protein